MSLSIAALYISDDLGSALLRIGYFHFQFRISGMSWPCLSM